jgi:anti-sigma-K factor RskA
LNIHAYISSGILESYLLGELSETECAEVNAMAKQYPEIEAEIEAIETTMMQVVAKTPPPHLKQAILNKIDKSTTEVVSLYTKKHVYTIWLAAASIALLIVSAAYNFLLVNKLKLSEDKLSALNLEKDQSKIALATQSKISSAMANELAILKQPDTKKTILKGLDSTSNLLATVYWNKNSNDVYLNIDTLPQPAMDKQYQLWAIVDGKPVDAGIFELNNLDTLQKMKSVFNAQAFAVTLENKGGSITPTISAMCLLGNI